MDVEIPMGKGICVCCPPHSKHWESLFIAPNPHPLTDFNDLLRDYYVFPQLGCRVDADPHIGGGGEIPQKPDFWRKYPVSTRNIKTFILSKLQHGF